MDKEGGAANDGGGGGRLRRWHGYAAAQIAALVVWSVGASAPDMHSDKSSSLLFPMFDFSLILTLVLLLLPALLAAVMEGVVFRSSGRASQVWVGLLAGFGLIASVLAIAAMRMLGDFDVSDGFAFHRLTWLGSLVGMELGLALELVVGSLIYLASPRNDGGQGPPNDGGCT